MPHLRRVLLPAPAGLRSAWGPTPRPCRSASGAWLYTYTVVFQSTPEFRTPYLLGYVDLPEGVRVLAPLADLAVDDVRIGMPLRLVVEPVRTDAEGRAVLGYRLHRAQPATEIG